MEPLKNIYSTAFFEELTKATSKVIPVFNKDSFLKEIYNPQWKTKELKQRMRHISTVLNNHLPGSYNTKLSSIRKIIFRIREINSAPNSLAYMIFPDFVEVHGINDPDISLKAMEFITTFTSCEFAIRSFLLSFHDKCLMQMLIWSRHENHHVRRLASEGSRPRLPWAMAIPALKKDPRPILPILENLKNDPSEYVRRSVANNLNDIAKDNPSTVLEIAKKWKGINKETDWIIKHGCRTLLKKADPEVYSLFDLKGSFNCEVKNIKLDKTKLRIGERLNFSFHLFNKEEKTTKCRVEYAVYYMKSNGKQTRKLFKITENSYDSNTSYAFSRSLSFRDLTTRVHYPGKHSLAIVINGVELSSKNFTVNR